MGSFTRIRSDRGFTLSEVVVALVITATLATIAVPSLTSMKAEYDLATATNRLAFEIARTRMQAVGQNKYMRIRRLSDTVYARENSTDGTTYTQEETTTLPSNVALTVGDTGDPTFNRSGLGTTTTTYTLTRQAGNRTITRRVSVNALGRVSVS